jgi:hypothetical protein
MARAASERMVVKLRQGSAVRVEMWYAEKLVCAVAVW